MLVANRTPEPRLSASTHRETDMMNYCQRRLSAALAATSLLAGVATLKAAPARPNIVLILADDLGYSDFGCFGSEISTPNIDQLAKDGVAFTQFYNQARCCPTRAALMTGRYQHQVGIGEMIDAYAAAARKAANSPAYQDHLSTNSPTMAELLRKAGYRTLMAGKWHLGKRPEEWPGHRGFDRSFVQINGAMNYFGGNSGNGPRDPMALDDQPYMPPHDGFYTTDAFTDHAIGFVEDAVTNHAQQPFFLYLAYNASHWPLQAPESDVQKYYGKYDQGWQHIRVERLEKMQELGIVPPDQAMAPMDRGMAKPWDKLTPEQRKQWARRMEVFAAQTEHLDREIGRLMGEIKRLGVDSNTLVICLSDNGGAAEDPNGGNHEAPIGDRDSFRGYARPWATVSNTPWWLHKTTAYEGGISTALLARWPAGIPAGKDGAYVREPADVMDLMPTFLDLAGAQYPTNGAVKPEGHSILPMIKGEPSDPNRLFCWEHEGNRAIRDGHWKLVALPNKTEWELFDISHDRIESHDLAAEHPDVVARLNQEYDDWATRAGVIPFNKIKETIRANRDATPPKLEDK